MALGCPLEGFNTCPCRKPIGWRLTENRAMLLYNERSCQAHCLGGCRSASVAGGPRDVRWSAHGSTANRIRSCRVRIYRAHTFVRPLVGCKYKHHFLPFRKRPLERSSARCSIINSTVMQGADFRLLSVHASCYTHLAPAVGRTARLRSRKEHKMRRLNAFGAVIVVGLAAIAATSMSDAQQLAATRMKRRFEKSSWR